VRMTSIERARARVHRSGGYRDCGYGSIGRAWATSRRVARDDDGRETSAGIYRMENLPSVSRARWRARRARRCATVAFWARAGSSLGVQGSGVVRVVSRRRCDDAR